MNLDYLIDNWDHVVDLAIDHLQLSLVSVGLALLVAIPLGVLITAVRPLSLPVLIVLSVLYTIPSLAFLAFLIPWLDLGRKPAIFALVVYAQLTLVRNISAGLRKVDGPTLEAARGIGMSPWQVLRKVRFPLAVPIVLAGIRIAMVTTISLATITAWVGAGGLGTVLFDGISRNYPSQILAGAIAITTLAILADLLLRGVERMTAASRSTRSLNLRTEPKTETA